MCVAGAAGGLPLGDFGQLCQIVYRFAVPDLARGDLGARVGIDQRDVLDHGQGVPVFKVVQAFRALQRARRQFHQVVQGEEKIFFLHSEAER